MGSGLIVLPHRFHPLTHTLTAMIDYTSNSSLIIPLLAAVYLSAVYLLLVLAQRSKRV